jgi:hypothetical protein
MKICIIDPAAHIPTLKTLFPEAEYYAHEPDDFFTYISTKHYTRQQVLQEYGFEYRIDWETITSSRYDYVFISAPLSDYYNCCSRFRPYVDRMKQKIKNILDSNSFTCVCLFDTYDYDYDPSKINTEWKVNYYFKRNYNKHKSYASNVFPFPYIMFVKPDVLQMVLTHNINNNTTKVNKALWAGGLYNHVDETCGVYRMRQDMHQQIRDYIDTSHFTESEFINAIRRYKVVVDLVGVGDPNKRTFEILTNGTLMLSMCGDLEWGFDNNDAFHPDTFFHTATDFQRKLLKILANDQHYEECLKQQNYIVQKYFNKKWLRSYIQKKIGYRNDTVSLFLTSFNRPDLLRQTLESFVRYNTYPIEYGVIVEDSGLKGINDFAHEIVPFPLKIIYADIRRGQMKSIENGLQYLNTKYVFHCEEDWEFYRHGFIEDSMAILKKNSDVTSVRLRSHHEMTHDYHMTLTKVENENYWKVSGDFTSYSWNPSLRTIEVQTMFTPYDSAPLHSICEGGLAVAFEKIGKYTVMTDQKDGYVRHIGWGHHVY